MNCRAEWLEMRRERKIVGRRTLVSNRRYLDFQFVPDDFSIVLVNE